MRRDWSFARQKVEQEGRCRLAHDFECGGPLAAAHVIERGRDDDMIVDPVDIIPLCTQHHALYDARRVSILHVLSLEEQAAAVCKLGIYRALRRVTSGTTRLVEGAPDRPD
jgi:hypothetical protein